jgi:type 1 glutamine amidotransferase
MLIQTLQLAVYAVLQADPSSVPAAGPGLAPAISPSEEAQALAELEPGFSLRIYASELPLERVLAPLPDQSPNLDELRARLWCDSDADFGGFTDRFVVQASASLRIATPGRYGFRLTSDDGSYLTIGGQRVVLNDGEHPATAKTGSIELAAGLHALEVYHFENSGEQFLTLEWQPPGSPDYVPLEAPAVWTPRNVTRVVAPGPKRFMEALEGLTPGDGLPLADCHPGWRIEDLRPRGFEPKVGALCWLPDGRLGVATFDPRNNGVRLEAPNGSLWALSNLDSGDPEAIQVELVAEGLYHPLGLLSIDGAVYVAERDQITRLSDLDGDGRFEQSEPFARGWTSDNYHHFTFGLERRGQQLFTTLSTSIGVEGETLSGTVRGINGPNPAGRGNLLAIDLTPGLSPEKRVRPICGGFRTPNGLLLLPDGSALVADNQGAWKPASRIDHARPGHFFGHYNETRVATEQYPNGGHPADFAAQPESNPAIWLPQGEVANSPTGMVALPAGPFAGQFLFGELKLGGIRRGFVEEVEGQLQGGALRFAQGFEGGVNRLLWAPDGSLILGMTGESASWSWRGTTFGLQRLVPTGGGAFEIHSVSATPQGFRLRFTERVSPAALSELANYTARSWRYRASPEYGGEKLDERDLTIRAATPEADGFSVELTVGGLETGTCVHLRAVLESERGERIWSPECWYTLNRIPGQPLAEPPPWSERGVLIFSKTAGFRHSSIETGAACLLELCAELGLAATHSEDADLFDDQSLGAYRAVVFLSTTGDVLDLRQEAAFERFVRAGGGFFGIHAAADTEYDWPFYGELIGAYFASHPAIQRARQRLLQRKHPALRGLPAVWERNDEWYDFQSLPGAEFERLLELDDSSYSGATTAQRLGSHPIAWCRRLGNARILYTGGGHTEESFEEPEFRSHLKGALAWVTALAD